MNRIGILAAGMLVLGILALVLFLTKPKIGAGVFSDMEVPPQVLANETLEAWVDMWNRYDLSDVDRVFLTDGRVSYFSSETRGLVRGIEALREHHRRFGFVPGGKEQGNTLRLSDVESTVFGPVTVVTSDWYFYRAGEADDLAQSGPVTFVFVREGKKARIAHAHFADHPAESR